MIDLVNWAGNYRFHAQRLHAPRSLEELREIVKRATKLKAIGTRHSFNGIADTDGDLISLEYFNQIDEPDSKRMTVTLGAGVRYGELAAFLHARGYALHNLASLPHISVAGACATSTHGSGVNNGNLATAVRAMQLVTADGDVRNISPETEGERFNGMVVHLGLLGVVTSVTLQILPTFEMCQTVYQNLPMSALESRFDAVMSCAYSVSLFTTWKTDHIDQVWIKQRTGDPTPLDLRQLGATPATRSLHPLEGCSPVNCTEQLGIAGPWHHRLPHFRIEFTPSAGQELQSEYFIPRERALPALRAIHSLREHITPHLFVSEIRTIAADELWLSPCYRRASVGIHFTWKPDWLNVQRVLPRIEQSLEPFAPRPHWGKLFTIAASQVQSGYERFEPFQSLVRMFDSHSKLRLSGEFGAANA